MSMSLAAKRLSINPMGWWHPRAIAAYDFEKGRSFLRGVPRKDNDVLAVTRSSGIILPNAAGAMQTLGNNTLPRSDRGLYANGQIANLCLYSDTFSDAWWDKTNLTVGSKTDGFTLLTAQAASNVTPVLRRSSGSIVANTGLRAAGLVVRPTNWTRFQFGFSSGLNASAESGALAIFELSGAGSVVGALAGAAVRRLTLTDYLIWVWTTAMAGSTTTQRFSFAMVNPTIEMPSSSGIVFNPAGTETVYVRDAFAGNGLGFAPEAAIRTEGSTATLLASDILGVQGTRPSNGQPEPFAGWEAAGLDAAHRGVVNVEIDRLSAPTVRFIAGAGADASNLWRLVFDTDNRFKLIVRKSGSDVLTLQSGVVATTGLKKVEWRAKPGGYAVDATGVAGTTSASSETLPGAATTLRVGSNFSVANPFNGRIANLQLLEAA
ncbi:MAG: hypothetical protein KF765_12165 [Parvibaculaceae bacterium]|nr:hypothetical protein [Parvibaculaceae bacterium]